MPKKWGFFMKINKILCTAAAGILGLAMSTSTTAHAQQNFLGEIIIGGWNFCPRGTAALDGQLLSIGSNAALFSLLGTNYGGDGRNTFGLPDLRGRTALHVGTGPGLTPRRLGSRPGSESASGSASVNITTDNLPSHTHRAGIRVSRATNNAANPRGNSFGVAATDDAYVGPGGGLGNGIFMDAETVNVQNAGRGQPLNVTIQSDNMQPSLTLQYCIVTQGVFPARN